MRVLHGTYSAFRGGAARASFRVHMALKEVGVDSAMLVADEADHGNGVYRVPDQRLIQLAARAVDSRIMKLQRSPNPVLHSPAILPGCAGPILEGTKADIVQLHWLGGSYLSIEQIGRLTRRKKVAWRLPDMWAFSGTEHYTDDESTRPNVGYSRSNRPNGHAGADLDRLAWVRKRQSWEQPAQIIAPSRWLADQVAASVLMRSWPVTVIPNPLDLHTFKQTPRELARYVLEIDPNVPLIVFGADGGTRSKHKGWDLLLDALGSLATRMPSLELAVFGQKSMDYIRDVPVRTHHLGRVDDDRLLTLIYSAADVVVVPSRREAFGQVASEAQACGAPVVAFSATGVADIVKHGTTGYLVDRFETEELAEALMTSLVSLRTPEARENCRKRAVSLFSPKVVGQAYADLYRSMIRDKIV